MFKKTMKKTLGSIWASKKVRFRSSVSPNIISKPIVLGIETSCDDTGCAVVDSEGKVIGDALHSQQLVHLRNGGIIPPVAQDLHRQNIESVVQETLDKPGLDISSIAAIAVTVKPGLPLSLAVGSKYAKHLARKYSKPLIPIHHMEAHALTARMLNKSIEFPFLTLLISGGHCLLCWVQDVDKFYLLGESLDDAPGEAFDKTARRMKLKNIKEYSTFSGGQAIETAALKATGPLFDFPLPLSNYRDCNFSFTGLKNSVLKKLLHKEREHCVLGDGLIPEINELCASFQLAVARHICHRTQRAMEFLNKNKLLDNRKQLVVSGGVACNNFIFKCLQYVCEEASFECYRPPPKLCTDNGIMIAWNGMERLKRNIGVIKDVDEINKIDIESKCSLGESWIERVKNADLQVKAIKLNDVLSQEKSSCHIY